MVALHPGTRMPSSTARRGSGLARLAFPEYEVLGGRAPAHGGPYSATGRGATRSSPRRRRRVLRLPRLEGAGGGAPPRTARRRDARPGYPRERPRRRARAARAPRAGPLLRLEPLPVSASGDPGADQPGASRCKGRTKAIAETHPLLP